MKTFGIIIVFLLSLIVTKAQKRADTTTNEFTNLYSNGDTSFVKTKHIDDSILVRQEYYGKSLDESSISLSTSDTFIVYKDEWRKMFDGKGYPFLSKEDFANRRVTIELIRSESPPNLRNRYTPVKKIKAGSETIYVYDMDVLHGEHDFYQDTRVYFSFKYGVVGYINYDTQMLMKKYVGKLQMVLRKAKIK